MSFVMELNKHPIWKSINPVKKRGHLARFFLARQYARLIPRSKLIGITGSVGKTTTALAAKAVLSQKMEVVSTTDTLPDVANLDPVFNLPLTVLRVRSKTKKVILEMGIEHPGEMDLYLSLVRPATAIITRISYAHSEFLGGIDQIIEEKGKLVEQLPENGSVILNWDDPSAKKMAEKAKCEVIYYGLDEKNCHVWAGKKKIENFQTVFELNYGVERVQVRSSLLGFHQIYPLLAAATLGVSLNIPLITIKKGLESLEGPSHRMETFSGINGSVIIDDTYNNASPVGLEEAVETLGQVSARRRILVLGEMRELGQFSEKLHREVARKIYKDKIDLVLLGGGDANFIAEELASLGFIPERLHSGLKNSELVATLLKVLSRGDVVLIKGSRATRLDEVVKRVVKSKR